MPEGAQLLAPDNSEPPLDLALAAFAWVAVGCVPRARPLHASTPDWAGDAAILTSSLFHHGHERIGLVSSAEVGLFSAKRGWRVTPRR